MENLQFSLNATLPVFFMIFLGWLLRTKNVIDADLPKSLNKLVFNLMLPVLLFRDIATADISESFSLGFFTFCFVVTILMFLIVWICSLFFIERSSRGAFCVCCCRGSAAVLGIAFSQNIYGNAGMVPMMIIASVPLYNIASVILYSVYDSEQKQKSSLKKVILNIITNPLIIGIIAGIPFSVLKVDFPVIIDKCINNIAVLATPVGLLMAGAGFSLGVARKKIMLISVSSFVKLVLLPVLFMPLAIVFGFRNQELIAILIMTGSPTTVAAYIMASSMNNDSDLASGVVAVTTLFSAVTVTGAIFILRLFGYI